MTDSGVWRRLESDRFVPARGLSSALAFLLPAFAVAYTVLQSVVLVAVGTAPPGVVNPMEGFPRWALLLQLASSAAVALLTLVLVPLWLAWLYYGVRNAHALARDLSFSPRQAALLSLIPGVGVATTWVALAQVYRASHPDADPRSWRGASAGLVHAYGVLSALASLSLLPDQVSGGMTSPLNLLAIAAAVGSALCLVPLVREIQARQEARYRRVLLERQQAAPQPAAKPADEVAASRIPSGTGEAAPGPPVAVQSRLRRCPRCDGPVAPAESVVCEDCLARHHTGCWDDAGVCGACGGVVKLEPEGARPTPPPRPRPRPAGPPPPLSARPGPAGTIFCDGCGRDRLVSESGRCPVCGARLAASRPEPSPRPVPFAGLLRLLLPVGPLAAGVSLVVLAPDVPTAAFAGLLFAFAAVVVVTRGWRQ